MDFRKYYKLMRNGSLTVLASCALILGAWSTVNADEKSAVNDSTTSVQTMDNVDNSSNQGNTVENSTTNTVNDADTTQTLSKDAAENSVQNSTSSQNGWVKDNQTQQWTYYIDGQVASGRNYSYLPTINGQGKSWYLVDNGVVQSGVQKWANTYYYFDPQTYLRVDNNYVQSQWGDWYMFGQDGRIATRVYQWAGTY